MTDQQPGYDQETRTLYMTAKQWKVLQLAAPGLPGMRDPWSRVRQVLRWLDDKQWDQLQRDWRSFESAVNPAVRMLTAPRIVVIPEPEPRVIASGHNWRVVPFDDGVALEVKGDITDEWQVAIKVIDDILGRRSFMAYFSDTDRVDAADLAPALRALADALDNQEATDD